jgi:hypothetical protein
LIENNNLNEIMCLAAKQYITYLSAPRNIRKHYSKKSSKFTILNKFLPLKVFP